MAFSTSIVAVMVSGSGRAAADLRRRKVQFEGNVARGLKMGGAHLLRKSLEIVPVDQGPLRASGFVRHSGIGFKTIVRVGYTAEYALLVHENLDFAHGEDFNIKYAKQIARGDPQPWNGKTFHKRGPNQKAEFLRIPAKEERNAIAKIVIKEAQRKIT